MIGISFKPWPTFYARKDSATIHRWLDEVGKASVRVFKEGASSGFPPSSSPGEWPHRRTGLLLSTINHEVGNMEVTVGSGAPYSGFLRSGTIPMRGRRKMSDDALKEGIKSAHIGRWVHWSRS